MYDEYMLSVLLPLPSEKKVLRRRRKVFRTCCNVFFLLGNIKCINSSCDLALCGMIPLGDDIYVIVCPQVTGV